MNKYWLLAFIIWSAGMFVGGVKYEGYKAGEKSAELQVGQQNVTMSAQTGVIKQQESAAVITQTESHNYEKYLANIDSDYSDVSGGLYDAHVAAGGSVRANAASPGRPATACPSPTSKKFKLTPRQCDVEELKLVVMWGWYEKQRQNQKGNNP